MSKSPFTDVLRAEAAGLDLQEGQYGVHVYAMRQDGTLYELGSVSESMVYQDPQGARTMISRIKFQAVIGRQVEEKLNNGN